LFLDLSVGFVHEKSCKVDKGLFFREAVCVPLIRRYERSRIAILHIVGTSHIAKYI
jgi:hypothetical protein